MKEFATIEEAKATPGVVRVEATDPPRGYFAEDPLPIHMQSDDERAKSKSKPMSDKALKSS